MRTPINCILLILLTTATVNVAAPLPKEIRYCNDEKMIVGKWKTEKLSVYGVEQANNFGATVFQFNAEGKTSSHAGQQLTFSYSLDPNATPRRMKWDSWNCVYELKGDQLLLCFVNPNTEHPKTIEPGPNLTIYTLSRVRE